MNWLADLPHILLFTGKGGVGKTSLAASSAVHLADQGKRILLVSTDPASNLDEVLATELGAEPVQIEGVQGLHGMNIDPLDAAARYRARVVDPLRGVLPEESLRSIEEQLSGACTVEIAAFNEFTQLIGDAEVLKRYDHIVLDTAPTGHTLRLLALPAAWNEFIADNRSGTSCLGPLSGLQEQRQTYAKAVEALRDEHSTRVVLVSRPERGAMEEAARAATELREEGIHGLHLIMNGVYEAHDSEDPLARSWSRRATRNMEQMPEALVNLPLSQRPFRPGGLIGANTLRDFLADRPLPPLENQQKAVPEHQSLEQILDQLQAEGPGVVMCMGKGGVGKTTVAAAIARGLALRGLDVHLSTTDPAAHVAGTLGDTLPNLEVGRIDPKEETRKHIESVLAESAPNLDAAGLELLEEELRSPCTEEVAVFQAFASTVAKGDDRYVVLDTAPTGHTLLLLDASEAYHREVLRDQGELPDSVVNLLPKLRNPLHTRVILVTLPEATPVHEAERLQEDLRRAGIDPRAWVMNQSLARAEPQEDRLQRQAQREIQFLDEAETLSRQLVILPWQAEEPVGASGLDALLSSTPQPTT